MSDIDFAALAAPIPQSAVKELTRKYRDKNTGEAKQFSVNYITARTVMNRLDGVAGPENWYDEYDKLSGVGVKCTLYLRVDGEWMGKQDVGTETDIEEDKGAFSDALKRAAVKWGIGREIYGDGSVYEYLRKQQDASDENSPVTHQDASHDAQDTAALQPPASDDGDAENAVSERHQTARGERSTQDAPEQRDPGWEAPAIVSDEFPTIRGTWAQFVPQQLKRSLTECYTLGMSGMSIAGKDDATVKALGYTDWKACKEALGMKTTKNFTGTLEELLVAILGHAPAYNAD